MCVGCGLCVGPNILNSIQKLFQKKKKTRRLYYNIIGAEADAERERVHVVVGLRNKDDTMTAVAAAVSDQRQAAVGRSVGRWSTGPTHNENNNNGG